MSPKHQHHLMCGAYINGCKQSIQWASNTAHISDGMAAYLRVFCGWREVDGPDGKTWVCRNHAPEPS